MYVLGISGSPRTSGNTDILIEKVLDGAKAQGANTEKIVLNSLSFSPCQECENVKDDGTCILNDDMQPLYRKIEDADVIVLGSPVFFGSLSAQTKMMIDRFQCLWRARYITKKAAPYEGKSGAFICTEASRRRDFFDNAKSVVKNLFATVNAQYSRELFCPGVDDKARILEHPDMLRQAFELGKALVDG